MIDAVWNAIPEYYPCVDIGTFQIMPNHIHGIIIIVGAGPCACPDDGQSNGGQIDNGQPQGVLLGQPKNGQPQGGAPTMSLPMNILAVLNNRVGRAFPVIYGNVIIMNLEATSILTQGIKS